MEADQEKMELRSMEREDQTDTEAQHSLRVETGSSLRNPVAVTCTDKVYRQSGVVMYYHTVT